MRLGVNLISPFQTPVIKKLFADGEISFCEIILDNFIHLAPEKMRAALPDIPFAFHIVASRFLERSELALNELATAIRKWSACLQPIYISDHLAHFTQETWRWPFAIECDYAKQYACLIEKVNLWQDMLETKVYFENHASLTIQGQPQIAFYKNLLRETKSGLLFDFSNAFIAQHNKVAHCHDWHALILQSAHYHVAGFRIDKTTQLALDTHDRAVDDEVLQYMKPYMNGDAKTLVIEFEAQAEVNFYEAEITRIRSVCKL